MTNYTKNNIGSGYNTTTSLNAELEKVETAVNSKLDKTGGSLSGDLSMESNDLLNVNHTYTAGLTLNGNVITGVSDLGEVTFPSLSSVTYTNTGTGATGRPLQDKLDDVVSVKDFGAVGDGVTDNSTALQAWLDYIYANGKKGYVPAGHYKFSTPLSVGTALKRLNIEGAGDGDLQNFINNDPAGSVLEYTGTTGNAVTIGDGSTTNIQATRISNLAIWANTTGKCLFINKNQASNYFEKLFIGQAGKGDGFGIEQCWVGSVRDVYCYASDLTNTGRGFYWDVNVIQGGVVSLDNISGRGFDRGIVLGNETQGSGFQLISIRGLLHGLNCNKGIVISEAVKSGEFICWTEENATCGMQVFNEVDSCSFRHYSADPDATEGCLVIGKSGGTNLENTVTRCDFICDYSNVNAVGIKLYQASTQKDNIIDRPKMRPRASVYGDHDGAGNAATLTDSSKSWTTNQFVGRTLYNITDGSSGTVTANTATTITATLSGGTDNDWDVSDAYSLAEGIDLGVSNQNGLKVYRPDLANFGNDIKGSQTSLEEYEVSGQDGLLTRYAPLDVKGGIIMGDTTQVTTTKTLVATDDYLQLCNANGGAFTITLPDNASNAGLRFHIKKVDGSANAVTISRAGSDTIEGVATKSLASQFDSYTVYSGGNSVWYIE